MTFSLLFQAILITSSAVVITKGLKLKNFAFFYLCFLPFLVFYQGSIQLIFFALLFGVLLSLIAFKSSWVHYFLIFPALLLFFITYRPEVGINNYAIALHFINQQRGEHLTPFFKLISRLFHNKLSLFYTISQSFQEYFSPATLFIQGKYKFFVSDYLLGHLYPYDALFLVLALRRSINKKVKKSFNYFAIILLGLYLLFIAFFTNPDIKYIFGFAITYFLATYLIKFISTLSPRVNYLIFTLNAIFLISHFLLGDSFIAIP